MPKPFTPWGITRFLGENDTVPATEIEEMQASVCQNLYIVNGGLERRLGGALINTTLGSSVIQGLQWCQLDAALSSAGFDAAETAGSSMLSPLDPSIVSDLELYLRGDQAAGANGAGCASWVDLSSHGRNGAQAVGANQPLNRDGVSANGLRRMLEWDGVNDSMAGSFPAFPPGIDRTGGYTVYIYLNCLSLSTGGAFPGSQLAFSGNGLECMLRTDTGDSYPVTAKYGIGDVNFGSPARNSSATSTTTGVQMLAYVWDSSLTSCRIYKNGILLDNVAATWDTTWATGWSLGANSANNSSCRCYYGACVAYSTEHNNATISGVGNWLTNYFEG
jgi:hypothetical protein